jgi:hypothetical protein
MTYTSSKSFTRTDEETSTDGATDSDHVQMAGLHGLVQDNQWTTLGTARERLQVETVAGHEILLLTPFTAVLTLLGGDGRLRDAMRSLLIDGSDLFVVHDGLSAEKGRQNKEQEQG